MKNIVIVGAGGFGREAVYIIKAINAIQSTMKIKGFIDDNLNALDGKKCQYQIIGRIKDWQPKDDEYFVLGIASPKVKETVVNILKPKGARFVTLIHPAASISDYVEIGEGCVISGRSSIGDCVKIGNFVHLAGSMIGQDSVIGDFSTTTGFVNIASAIVGKRVFVGSHSVVLNNVKVGDDAFVCAGSIVFTNVKEGTQVFGCPAKRMSY